MTSQSTMRTAAQIGKSTTIIVILAHILLTIIVLFEKLHVFSYSFFCMDMVVCVFGLLGIFTKISNSLSYFTALATLSVLIQHIPPAMKLNRDWLLSEAKSVCTRDELAANERYCDMADAVLLVFVNVKLFASIFSVVWAARRCTGL